MKLHYTNIETTQQKNFELQWLERYQYLKRFVDKNGHYEVPRDFRDSLGNLYAWRNTQRMKYEEDSLSQERIRLMEKLPNWTWQRKHKKIKYSWPHNFDRLIDCLKKDEPPPTKSPLGIWYLRQKSFFKEGKLSKERVKAFEKVGILLTSKQINTWDESYRLLVQLGKAPSQSTSLGQWIYKQKYKFRNGKLAIERVRKLEALSFFNWDIKAVNPTWGECFIEFSKFVKQNNRFPKRREALGSWFFRQRERIQKGNMSEEQHKKLKSISGWKW